MNQVGSMPQYYGAPAGGVGAGAGAGVFHFDQNTMRHAPSHMADSSLSSLASSSRYHQSGFNSDQSVHSPSPLSPQGIRTTPTSFTPNNAATSSTAAHQPPAIAGPGPVSTPTRDQPGSASPQKYSMAAPSMPASAQHPDSPKSPGHHARERERVALLLDINADLIQELSDLQAQGKGGAMNAQQAAQNKAQGLGDELAADEFVQAIMRFQANLAYLYNHNQADVQAAGQSQSPVVKRGPAHPPLFTWHPSHMPQLEDKYARLRQLFPGWQGRDTPRT